MMKILLASFIVFTINLFPQVMCIAGKQFETSEDARRAGIETVIQATFDVKKFKPENIHLELLDSTELNENSHIWKLFEKVTIDNINKITFLKDTTKFIVTIQYILKYFSYLNNDYAELVNGNILKIYTRMDIINTTPFYCKFGFFKTDSTYTTLDIPFEMIKGELKKSEILVQRILEENKDSVIILKNNYPELSEYIIQQAALKTRKDFDKNAKYFYIKFEILREEEDCGIKQYY